MLTTGRCSTTLLVLIAIGTGSVARARQTASIEQALKYEGRRIVEISFEPGDQPLSRAELLRRLPFDVGAIFHEQMLRAAIQDLYATGRFADLAVDGTLIGDGMALRFITQPAYFVGRVAVLGVKAPPSSGQLSSATKLVLGTRYSSSAVQEGQQALKILLRDNGFYHASVAATVDLDAVTSEANVRFGVGGGRRARFEQPVITGDVQLPQERIVRATHWRRLYGWRGWQELTQARLTQGLENIRRYYEKHNLLESRVSLARLTYHDASNTVQPVIHIDPGPRIVLRTLGANLGRDTLNRLVPVSQEHSIDSELLLEGSQNIQQYLQSQGYFDAEVTYKMSNSENPNEVIITYDVSRGIRRKLAHLEIEGNHYFTQRVIRERLYIQTAEFPRFPFGRFDTAYLRQDIQSIESLYVSNGFRDVKVSSRIMDRYRGVRNHLAVFLTIKEGPQWMISSLSIEGAGAALDHLTPMLACTRGQPFSEARVADDRENILNYYYDQGYLSATLDFYVAADAKPAHVNLRYVVRAGSREYVRNVFVTGLETTRRALVYDRVELKNGQPLSLAEQTDSQRRLYDLGIFARVNTAIQNPDGDETDKNILYDIDEARHYSVNVGAGAQIARIGGGVTSLDNPAGTTGFAPRFAFGISRLDFLGLGQTLGLQTSVSTIEQRGALTYFIPQFVSNENLNFTATALIDDSSDIRTFTAHRREGSIQLGERLSRAYSVQYRLVFRHVTLSNLKIDQLLVPLLSQPETVGLAEFSVIEDKRDDPTDAHHGLYNTVDLGYAAGFLGSQTQFARGLFRNSTYYTVHRDLVIARSTQFGVISRTGGRPSIPLAERLYSGGSTSIRAFPDFQAGPRDLTTGFPLGGNALFINNTELRFPLFGDNVGGVLFEDAGNVYSTWSDFSVRFRQRNLQDFNYMVQNAGFGIRYRTPIGPLRIDLSLSPNAPRFFGLKGTQQDYLNGTAVPTVQKINAFQFHISLGQAF